MNELIKNTTDYFDYLINEVGFNASVHFLKEAYPQIPEKVMTAITPYTIHRNPYCVFVKSSCQGRCVENQREIITSLKCSSSCEHTCYANVKEIVYPIFRADSAIGYLSASGYKGDDMKQPSFNDTLWHSSLADADIPRSLIDTLFSPLKLMIEKLVEYDCPIHREINMILRYLSDHYRTATLSDLAHHFGRSRSHVSHLFKSKTGKTVRAYCNDLKLFTAQNLLSTTELSVTEIGLDSGFEDTSYFVRLYREKYGITPYQYRKSNLTSKAQYSIMKKTNKGDKQNGNY